MAAVVAIKIAAALGTNNCRVHTDCQSVQKLLTQRNLLRSLSKKENLVLLQLGMTKTNGYFTLVNLVQGVHIKQSLSRAPRPTVASHYYVTPPIENASITF
jgi:hypothetical protein